MLFYVVYLGICFTIDAVCIYHIHKHKVWQLVRTGKEQ